jgi:hypothetical protein
MAAAGDDGAVISKALILIVWCNIRVTTFKSRPGVTPVT